MPSSREGGRSRFPGFSGSSRKVGGANKGLGEAKKAARGRSMKARPTQSRKGVKGHLPLAGSRDSVPCGVWGNAPTVPRQTYSKEELNKGAGSEASLPLTLRVRRRAPKLLFPQDSVKNLKKAASLLWKAALFVSVDLHFSGNSITCIAASPLHPLWRTPFGD